MTATSRFTERVHFIMIKENDKSGKGPNGGSRLQTVWVIDGKSYVVSSVENPLTQETMMFPIIDGEIDYFEEWVTKEYLSNVSQHAVFIDEYLAYHEGVN